MIASEAQVWLTFFFGIGTTFWYEATLGDSWNFAVVMSVPATLLALNELFGKGRPFVVALCAGFAALARYDLVLAWPFYLALLWARGKSWRTWWAREPVINRGAGSSHFAQECAQPVEC